MYVETWNTVMLWIVSPQNIHFETLTHSISDYDFEDKAIKVPIKLKWGH